MGDPGASDSWKKLVISKANNQWVSINKIKRERTNDEDSLVHTSDFSLDYEQPLCNIVKTETVEVSVSNDWKNSEPPAIPESNSDPLAIRRKKNESCGERSARLAKMSAYAAQRLANETPEQRATRLRRMSEYAAKRLANETSEQRARRLARMSAYAAKRLAEESPEQRQARLARMSAYAAKRHAMKKINFAANTNPQANDKSYEMAAITQLMPNQSFKPY